MRNSAIACACLLAVFEGVGIAMQRMFAQAPMVLPPSSLVPVLGLWYVGTGISTCGGTGLDFIYSYVISPQLPLLSVFVK